MIVINRKRLIFVISTVIVSVISVGLVHKMQNPNTVSTVALPVSNKVVILDARSSVFQMRAQKVQMERLKIKLI